MVHINDEHIETANNLDIITNLYNLIEYSDNYKQSSASVWQYERDEKNLNAAGNINNVNSIDSHSFKYKSNLLKELTTRDVAANVNPDIANAHRLWLNAQIVVSFFLRSAEMILLNFKIHLELNWTKIV